MILKIVVTVGMGRWPFDRLLHAVAPLSLTHDVFVQRGTSDVPLACASARAVVPSELRRMMAEADVVITHAGNTVRLVQRLGKVPICVAREAARGEMGNDHQVHFLRREQQHAPAVGLWGDPAELTLALEAAVADHRDVEQHLLATRPLPPEPDLDRAWSRLLHELKVELTSR
ncbi:MAG: hypothetical protein IT195_01910 [Microthrixaceae bacterium]|nr:hypothetical protein [Microthrixaceae bacterium]